MIEPVSPGTPDITRFMLGFLAPNLLQITQTPLKAHWSLSRGAHFVENQENILPNLFTDTVLQVSTPDNRQKNSLYSCVSFAVLHVVHSNRKDSP